MRARRAGARPERRWPGAEALVHRADVPLRETAERSLPAVPPDRRGSLQPARSGHRRRVDHPHLAPVAEARHGRRGDPATQHPRLQRGPRTLSRGPGGLSAGALRATRRRQPAAHDHQSAANPRQQGGEHPGVAGWRADPARLSRRRIDRPLRGSQGPPGCCRTALRNQPEAGARPGLLLPHGFRMGHRQAWRPGHRLRRWPLRRAGQPVRRQADPGRRFRHGRGTPGAAAGNLGGDPRRTEPSGRPLRLRLRRTGRAGRPDPGRTVAQRHSRHTPAGQRRRR